MCTVAPFVQIVLYKLPFRVWHLCIYVLNCIVALFEKVFDEPTQGESFSDSSTDTPNIMSWFTIKFTAWTWRGTNCTQLPPKYPKLAKVKAERFLLVFLARLCQTAVHYIPLKSHLAIIQVLDSASHAYICACSNHMN